MYEYFRAAKLVVRLRVSPRYLSMGQCFDKSSTLFLGVKSEVYECPPRR